MGERHRDAPPAAEYLQRRGLRHAGTRDRDREHHRLAQRGGGAAGRTARLQLLAVQGTWQSEKGCTRWWRFRRADGAPWGLAGRWNTWIDKASGEVHESYTMLTVNADAHPLMSRMHKPAPKLPPHDQDKRSVIPLEERDFDQWLEGTVEQAKALMRVPSLEIFEAGPIEAD